MMLVLICPAMAMPHDVAEAQGCKPRVEGSASFTCPANSKEPCANQRDGRRRAIADWQKQVRARHGDRFTRWDKAYFPTVRIEGAGADWTYTVSAYACPR
jgi:hypothetical protein